MNKTSIEKIRESDAFVSDGTWHKLTITKDDLVKAIEENEIETLVRRTLRHSYGHMLTFEQVVAEMAICVRLAVAATVRRGTDAPCLSVVYNGGEMQKREEVYARRKELSGGFGKYWVGEKEPL